MSIIFLTLTFFISYFSHSISAANNYELATQVCNGTANSKSCMKAFISDPTFQPSEAANPASLAYIIFRQASQVGAKTQTNIMSEITRNRIKRSVNLHGLRKCDGYYTTAVGALYQVLEKLDSDTYCYFDTLSATAQSNATACGKGLWRNQTSLARENGNFINLAGVCYAVAKLFTYNC